MPNISAQINRLEKKLAVDFKKYKKEHPETKKTQSDPIFKPTKDYKFKGQWTDKHDYQMDADDDGEKPKVYRVTAHDKDGKEVARADFGHHAEGGVDTAWNVKVHPKHKRKGIGNALYVKGEKDMGTTLHPFPGGHSDEAKKFWSQKNRPFGPDHLDGFDD